MLQRVTPGSNVYLILEGFPCRSLDLDISFASVPFDLGLPNRIGWMFRQGIADLIEAALLAAGPGVESEDLHRLIGPLPVPDLRHVVAMLPDVLLVFDQFVAHALLEMCTNFL